MLLFSTVLQINDLLTEEIFIQNVIEWNQNSPHQENIIPGIVWDGQESVRFGTDLVWMDITKYDKEEIVAVRYEKIAEDGVIWNSDFVVNFRERKMAIQLDRSYKEEALTADTTFSTPHFITMMIRGGYLVDDSNLAVDTEAFGVCKDHQIMLEALAEGDRRYRLPVVFVSKLANGDDPLDVRRLSYRLKGAAHVLTEECTFAQCEGRELACNGDVGIYYPNAAMGYRRFSYKGYTGGDETLLNEVVRSVIQYGISQNIDSLYTWQGVNNALLTDKLNFQIEKRLAAEHAKRAAEDEAAEVYDIFGDDLNKLQRQIEELTRSNEALRFENQGLRAKLGETECVPILHLGAEDDFYEGEIKDIVLSALEDALRNTQTGTRRADVLADVIRNNDYREIGKDREQRIKKLFKGYKSVSGPMRQELADLGIEVSEDGKHYKLVYCGDSRYWTTVAKTPSDGRDGMNVAQTIIKGML